MTTTKKPITMADILAIQAEQLADWKLKLNDKTYNLLLAFAMTNNAQMITEQITDPYKVCRGNDLDNYIANLYR